jgi:hypothetical protein
MADQQKTVTNDLATFAQALAEVIWEIHQANRLRDYTEQNLAHFGISPPETAPDPGQAPKFTITPPDEDEYLGGGIHRRDLSEAAKAERDADDLRDKRMSAYRWLRGKVREDEHYGYDSGFKLSEVTRQLAKLGFPQPQTETQVTGYIRQGDDQFHVSVTVPGTMTEDEARAKLASIGSHSARHLAIVEAFGEGSHSEALTESVSVRTSSVWPPLDK